MILNDPLFYLDNILSYATWFLVLFLLYYIQYTAVLSFLWYIVVSDFGICSVFIAQVQLLVLIFLSQLLDLT